MFPNDYGLTPPIAPRRGKTLCDAERPFPKARAEALVKLALARGMASLQSRGEWPQNLWVVDDGQTFEAELENQAIGSYHGYPMPADDEFAKVVITEWQSRG